jgi:hypothetical protein
MVVEFNDSSELRRSYKKSYFFFVAEFDMEHIPVTPFVA